MVVDAPGSDGDSEVCSATTLFTFALLRSSLACDDLRLIMLALFCERQRNQHARGRRRAKSKQGGELATIRMLIVTNQRIMHCGVEANKYEGGINVC